MRFVLKNPKVRFLCRFALYSGLGLLAILLTSRWWIPPVLPTILDRYQIEVKRVEHMTNGGYRLHELSMQQTSFDLAINQIELPNLFQYLWERANGSFSSASSIDVKTVVVRLKENPNSTESEPVNLPQVLNQIETIIQSAQPWTPAIEVDEVNILRDPNTLLAQLSKISINETGWQLQARSPTLPHAVTINATFPETGNWTLSLDVAELDLSGDFEINSNPSEAYVSGTLQHQEAPIPFNAHYNEAGWIPSAAQLQTAQFEVPLAWIPQLESSDLKQIQLTRLDAKWNGAAYHVTGDLSTKTAETSKTDLNAQASFQIKGDLDHLQLLEATVTSDWATLTLSEPIGIRFDDRTFEGDAHLSAQVDLGQLPWLNASGTIDAALSVQSNDNEPKITYSVNGSALDYQNYTLEKLSAQGWFNFDSIQIDVLQAHPTGTNREDLFEMQGAINWTEAIASLEFNGLLSSDWVNAAIGQPLFVEPLSIQQGSFKGWIDQPQIEGTFNTSIQHPATERIELTGDLKSTGWNRLNWTTQAAHAGATITAAGVLTRTEQIFDLTLKQLRWEDPERPTLNLTEPAQIVWNFNNHTVPWEQRLQISNLRLNGPDMSVALTCEANGPIRIGLQNVSLFRLDRWLKADLPHYQIAAIQADFSKLRPQLTGSLIVNMAEIIDSTTRVDLQLNAALSSDGVAFEQLNLSFQNQSIIQGKGHLPILIALPQEDQKSPIRLIEGASLEGTLKGQSTARFETWLEKQTAVKISNAHVDIDLQGALLAPSGKVYIEVDSIQTSQMLGEHSVPKITHLALKSKVDSDQLVIDHFSFSIKESEVNSTLRIPLNALKKILTAETINPAACLGELQGQLTLKDWRMENWTEYMPAALRRTGSLNGTLLIKPDLDLSGQLTFKDFALRPTQTLPSVDAIHGQLKLENQLLKIESASALFGGSQVDLVGQIDLKNRKQPQWQLALIGENVPVARTKDMILRSDLDLKVATIDESPNVLVSGKLNLRSSTLLIDFDPLAPSVAGGSRARPPFFQITEAPFADWRFDLKLAGDEFMRVRSPYFKTILSANLELKGSFANPELVGSVRTIGGELYFPGAKFQLDEGEAFIEPSRPDVVQLNFSGIAQKASRVIVMEVSQTMDDPHVLFQSTPQMSNAAIVRFLATGSTTGGGFGNVGLYLGQGMLGAGSLNSGITDNLTIDIGEETTRNGQGTLGARYELSPTWSVEGDYDVYDAYNANLIWSIFKR